MVDLTADPALVNAEVHGILSGDLSLLTTRVVDQGRVFIHKASVLEYDSLRSLC